MRISLTQKCPEINSSLAIWNNAADAEVMTQQQNHKSEWDERREKRDQCVTSKSMKINKCLYQKK